MPESEFLPTSQTKLRGMQSRGMSGLLAQAIAERKRRQEELLDAALEETFSASDPVSVMRVT